MGGFIRLNGRIGQKQSLEVGRQGSGALVTYQQAGDGLVELGDGRAHGIQRGEALQEASHIVAVVFGDLFIAELGAKQGGKPPVQFGPTFASGQKFLHFSSVDGKRETE